MMFAGFCMFAWCHDDDDDDSDDFNRFQSILQTGLQKKGLKNSLCSTACKHIF